MNNPQVIIIPDVHGRSFWKDAINKFPKDLYPNLQIIFLGDYLDPYESYDGISKEEAFVNFEDILDYAKNDSRVTLLIGNHDWHYFVYLDNCRMDKARERNIEHMFKENISMFRLHKIVKLDGTKYLFSHAGITQKWLDMIATMAKDEVEKWNPEKLNLHEDKDESYQWISKIATINETYDFDLFETSLKYHDLNFFSAPISMISRERGGYYPYGSLIWADIYEHIFNDDLPEFYQIFGHTYSFPNTHDPSISPNGKCFAMLDCGKAFTLDIEGNIELLK